MKKTRRAALTFLFGTSFLTSLAPSASGQNSRARVELEILEARTDGRRHTLFMMTWLGSDPLRIIVVYRRNGWQPGLTSSPQQQARQQERVLALATKVPGSDAVPGPSRPTRWELSFEEDGLPMELYAIACRVSDVHGGRSLRQELPDIRRILDQLNEPTYSQREKSIEDVLRALFEFDWQPLGYTQLSGRARRT